MPWQPLPRIAFAIATYPFAASAPADLPLELGDELYIIEQGGKDGAWFRGYLVAPPSLLAGLTSVKGQTLEARVFSGIFPRSCVEVREVLGDEDDEDVGEEGVGKENVSGRIGGDGINGSKGTQLRKTASTKLNGMARKQSGKGKKKALTNGTSHSSLSVVARRDPNTPKPPAPVPMLKIGDETPTSLSEPLVDEIASCLREWHSTNLHELLLSRQYQLLDKMSSLAETLDLSRRQFLHNVLTKHELGLLREKTVWDLVRGNKAFNGEVIVRDPAERGRVLTGDDSAVEITKLQSMMSLLDERPQAPGNDSLTLHHLLIDVRAFVGAASESTTLVFYLASKTPGQAAVALSESYIVDVPPSGALTSLAKMDQMRTLFTDLAAADIGEAPSADSELFLVVKVRTAQQVTVKKPGSRGGQFSTDGSTTSRSGDNHKPPLSGNNKAGRISLMWGQKSQRNFSRNAPISSKLNSLSEQSMGRSESRDGPPSTAGSRGLDTVQSRTGTITRTVIRTVGIGAIKVNMLMKMGEELEQVISVWAPSISFSQDKAEHGDGWDDLIKDLMDSKTGRYERSRKAERVQVHLKAFESPDADSLIKATPTLLAGIVKTSKMGFSGAPTRPRSDIYLTIGEAFLPRHALLSRSSGSATPVPSAMTGTNLQVTLEVRRLNGERIEGCIYPSTNAQGESSWESTAAERGDAWSQTLRLAVPAADVPGSHVVMVLADAPNQPFAICHMPLWDQQAFMRDGHHSLLLYKYDDSTATQFGNAAGKGGYSILPWNARGKDDVSKDESVTGPIATMRVETYLCSTKFSQNKALLGLLKWRELPPGDVQDVLKQLVFVPEIEIVKLLNDVLDAIFGILVEHAGNDDYEDLIFSCLVTVLGIVHDRRFKLGPLVDQYAENRFNYPFATPCLVRSFTRLLAKPSDPETSRKLRATFKVVRHILKFITHARGQQKAKEADIGITSTSPGFSRHLRAIFKALDGLMRNTAPILVGSQTLAVQHFHNWLPELSGLLSTEEILHIAIDFMDSCADVKGKLVLYKLVLIINYSRLDLFSQPEQKSALSANTIRWIAPHWGRTDNVTEQWREQVRLCCSILSTQIADLGPEVPDHIPKIIDSYLSLRSAPKTPKTRLSLLFPTTYPFPSKPISGSSQFDEALIELSAILSAVSASPAGMQLELADQEMATLIEDTLHVHLSILQCEAFPADWLSVRIYHHKSTMRTLEYLAAILLESFLPDPDDAEIYRTELWKAFFTTLLKLVGSDALALETFPEQKRRAVWKIAGDVREQGAELLRRTWESIGWETTLDERQRYGLSKMGGYQVQYVPALVGPIVELCLSVHEGLRRVAVEVLQTMIVSEWTLSQDLGVIQMEMIDCLDQLFKSKPLTESILQKLFVNELMALFEPLAQIQDEPLYAAVKELIATIDEFLDLLVAVHSTDVTGQASHMIHRLRLMEFLRDMQKEEIFIRYVHQLAELQATAGNHTEAGLALRLHADLYDWDPTRIVPELSDPAFPTQSHFDRKERIYFDMLKFFEDGEAWSSALEAYQELQAQYQENVFDFPKLARTQRAMATIYETIAKSEKLVPKYFKVTYSGMGFAQGLRDKEFVFEGSPTERTTAFTDRMQEMHPAAQVVTNSEPMEEVEGQFIHITPLSTHRDFERHVFQRARVPLVVRDYLLSSHPQAFSATLKRNTTGPVAQHSMQKTIYHTAEIFPTILRRSEIIGVERIKLDAVETALERVIRKTYEMAGVEKRILDGEEDMIPLLIEALNISVNPESETSVSRYRDLLPAPPDPEDEDALDEPEPPLPPRSNALRIALIDHAVMIKRCLAMLSKPPYASNTTIQEHRQNLEQSTSPTSFPPHAKLPLHPRLASQLTRAALDFEFTFAPELSSFVFPQPQPLSLSRQSQHRDIASPQPSWHIASPVPSQKRELGGGAMGGFIPNSMTNGTIATTDTSILESPQKQGRNERGRLSFLHRGTGSVENGFVNGKNAGNNATSELSSDHSRTKSNAGNRRSFFGGGGGGAAHTTNGTGLGRGRQLSNSDSHQSSENEWITQSDLSNVAHVNGNGNGNQANSGGRRSSSSQRPQTATSMGSRVGSVRKRLSLLKLGRKRSDVGNGARGNGERGLGRVGVLEEEE